MPDILSNIDFKRKPVEGFYPTHSFVASWVFQQALEANLADAIARVAEVNGMTRNDIMHLLPSILRMLKSSSEWTK